MITSSVLPFVAAWLPGQPSADAIQIPLSIICHHHVQFADGNSCRSPFLFATSRRGGALALFSPRDRCLDVEEPVLLRLQAGRFPARADARSGSRGRLRVAD